MTSVVHVTFLQFSDEGISARGASDKPPEFEVVDAYARPDATVKNVLDPVEEVLCDERIVLPLVGFSRCADAYHARVEGIAQERMKASERHFPAVRVPESPPVEFLDQCGQAPLTGAVELECLPNQWSSHWIDRF